MNSPVLTCLLPLPANYRTQTFLSFHNRDALAIAETVTANQLQKAIVWLGSPACLSFRLSPKIAEVGLSIDNPPDTLSAAELTALATRMLGLNQPIDDFEANFRLHAQLGTLIQRQAGLRVPAAASVFEAISWAITGQQISVTAAITIRRKFIQLFGLRHSSGLYCYPDAKQIMGLSINDLRQAGFSQRKAQTLLTLAQMAASGELALGQAWEVPPIAHIQQQLVKISGIGPWTLNYALLRGYGWLDGSLHGDAAVRRGLQTLLKSLTPIDEKQTQLWLEDFTPWRALVAAHLWELVTSGGGAQTQS
ncbi:MAG: AlkA N-terminal domain-containing protein [Methylococcaceae bacterium]|jgi:DNA-3-methyladenine glycosylase II